MTETTQPQTEATKLIDLLSAYKPIATDTYNQFKPLFSDAIYDVENDAFLSANADKYRIYKPEDWGAVNWLPGFSDLTPVMTSGDNSAYDASAIQNALNNVSTNYSALDPNKFSLLGGYEGIVKGPDTWLAPKDLISSFKPYTFDNTGYLNAGSAGVYGWNAESGLSALADNDVWRSVVQNPDAYKIINDPWNTGNQIAFSEAQQLLDSGQPDMKLVSNKGSYYWVPKTWVEKGAVRGNQQGWDPDWLTADIAAQKWVDLTGLKGLNKTEWGDLGTAGALFTGRNALNTGSNYIYLGQPYGGGKGIGTPIQGMGTVNGQKAYIATESPGISVGRGWNNYMDPYGKYHTYSENPDSDAAHSWLPAITALASFISPVGAAVGSLAGNVLTGKDIGFSDFVNLGMSFLPTSGLTGGLSDVLTDAGISSSLAPYLSQGLISTGTGLLQGKDLEDALISGLIGAGTSYAGSSLSDYLKGTALDFTPGAAPILGSTGANVLADVLANGGSNLENILLRGASGLGGRFVSNELVDAFRSSDDRYVAREDGGVLDTSSNIVYNAAGQPEGWMNDTGEFSRYADVYSGYRPSGSDQTLSPFEAALARAAGNVSSGLISSKGQAGVDDLILGELAPLLGAGAEELLGIDTPDWAVAFADKLVDQGVSRSVAQEYTERARQRALTERARQESGDTESPTDEAAGAFVTAATARRSNDSKAKMRRAAQQRRRQQELLRNTQGLIAGGAQAPFNPRGGIADVLGSEQDVVEEEESGLSEADIAALVAELGLTREEILSQLEGTDAAMA